MVMGAGKRGSCHKGAERGRRKSSRASESGIGSRQRDSSCQVGRRGPDRHIHVREGFLILPVLARHFKNHMELIGLGVDSRYLSLSEGIVQGIVDILRCDPQPAGGVAIDIDV